VQFTYVAYSQSRNQIIVGHEGTDPSQILSVDNDIHFSPTPLLTVLNVAGTPEGVEVHNGLQVRGVHRSTSSTLTSAQTAWVQTSTLVPDASVLVTGHSLGAAISLLDAIFLKQQLPSNTSIQVVGFGRPRVGNPVFANWVDSMVRVFPICRAGVKYPSRSSETRTPLSASGEVWIKDNTTTLACDGQENPNCSDTIGVLDAATGISDHLGPYFGVTMGHGSCANLDIVTTVVTGSTTETLTTTEAQITTPFSTALSLRVTNTPSNIPVNNKENGAIRFGGLQSVGMAMAVMGGALAGGMLLL
ncbi:Alpha/Beta hydrolase protein, partial [Mycena leptocephala]